MEFSKIELLNITPNADKLIEIAGRTCYKSEKLITDESARKFVYMILKNQHLSVLEHASATIRVSNLSRSCTHQLVRHRIAAYSQQSQRYVPARDFEFVIPKSIRENEEAQKVFVDCMDYINKAYKKLQELNIKKEDARYVLPNACCTEIVITYNFRQWKHFFNMRMDNHAQWEIRLMASRIFKLLSQYTECFDDQRYLYNRQYDEFRRLGIEI